MFGDDPDPTVMTERVGFGTGVGRAREGVLCIAERLKRPDNKRTVGLERDNEGNREKRELRTDHEFKKTCGCNADDVMMNATNK